MTKFDGLNVNDPTIHGLIPSTIAAREVWIREGSPLSPRHTEATRESILNWSPATDAGFAKPMYQLIVYLVSEGRWQRANDERMAAGERQRKANQDRRKVLSAELSIIREGLGLSQTEMATLTGQKYNLVHDAESANGGSYSTAKIATLLELYRVHSKMRGTPAKAKAQPKSATAAGAPA